MASITTSVVVAAVPLLVVLVCFMAVAHGLPEAQEREIEVKLFPPTIRYRAAAVAEKGQAKTGQTPGDSRDLGRG